MQKKSAVALLSAVLGLAFAGDACALNMFKEFGSRLTSDSMKPFARDLGGLIGAADFHSASVTGFPGFDIGVVGSFQAKPDKDNTILRDAGVGAFGLPIIQAEVGLPKDFGLVVRSMPISDGAPILGAGLRYGIFKHTVAKMLPDLTFSAFYDALNNDYMKFRHYSFDLTAGFDLPVVKPYAGIGFDESKLETKVNGVGVSAGEDTKSSEFRFMAGVSATPFPLGYVNAGLSVSHGQLGFQGGLGVRF